MSLLGNVSMQSCVMLAGDRLTLKQTKEGFKKICFFSELVWRPVQMSDKIICQANLQFRSENQPCFFVQVFNFSTEPDRPTTHQRNKTRDAGSATQSLSEPSGAPPSEDVHFPGRRQFQQWVYANVGNLDCFKHLAVSKNGFSRASDVVKASDTRPETKVVRKVCDSVGHRQL